MYTVAKNLTVFALGLWDGTGSVVDGTLRSFFSFLFCHLFVLSLFFVLYTSIRGMNGRRGKSHLSLSKENKLYY